MIRERLWPLVLLAAFAQPALGHTTSGGLAEVDLDTGRIEARLAQRDLAQLPNLVSGSQRELGERVRERIVIEVDGQLLALTLEGIEAHDRQLHISLRAPSVPARTPVSLTLMLFPDVDPEHRTLVRLVHGGESRFRELPDREPWRPGTGAAPGPLTAGQLGVVHVLEGWDHLLFVAVLVLGALRLRSTLVAVSWFTLGHAVSLVALTLGAPTAPASVIEPLIALSIVYAGMRAALPHDVADANGGRQAAMVVVLCGAVHGLGFAGALRELGLDGVDALAPMVGFNVGVELAQLAWAALVFGAAQLTHRLGRGATSRKAAAALITVIGAIAFLTRL